MREVMELLHAKLNIARQVLADLVRNYQDLNDDERLEKSDLVFGNVNSYVQIQGNLIFPLMTRTGEHDDLVQRSRTIHERIDALMEHAIMMHVDEPGFEYYDNLVRLQGLLDLMAKTDSETVFPWAETYLSEDEHYELIQHLNEQTRHESITESFYYLPKP